MRTQILVVTFKNEDIFFENKIRKILPENIKYDLVIVDTGFNSINGEILHGANLNYNYEFSGYAYGLSYASSKYKNGIDCIVMNDTIFTSHASIHVKAYIKKLISSDQTQKSISGIVCKFGSVDYIPTYLFRIRAPSLSVNKWMQLFLNIDKNILYDVNHLRKIELWLNPKNFYSGWYRSMPWSKLPVEEYERKKKTIQLEHSLLKNLEMENFTVKSIKSVFLSITSFLDRLNTHLLKLRYRFF